MSVLRIKQEDGTWTSIAAISGEPGRDGAVQYTPGNGIVIDENNVIKLDMDVQPTELSTKPVTSDGIKYYVDNAIQDAGGGDMLRSIYDTDHDGTVDNAEKVNGHTVAVDVPLDAVFTDTTYLFNTAYNAQTNRAASMADVPTKVSQLQNDAGYITGGYVEQEPAFNGSVAKTITAEDIANWNAKSEPILFNTPYDAVTNKAASMADIPTDLSDLNNDSGFMTSYTESDPVFSTSPAFGITANDIMTWNNKQNAIVFNTTYNATGNKAATMADIPVNVSAFNNDAGYITAAQVPAEQEPDFNASVARTITSTDINNWNAKQDALVFNTAYDATLNKVATMNDIPTVPTDLGDFTNNVGYITSYTETDPIFLASPAHTITYNDINNWNDKQDGLVFNTTYNAVTNKVATMADINPIVFNTTYDAITNKAATMEDVNTKQDTLVFNTAYDATTNKVATMADIIIPTTVGNATLTIQKNGTNVDTFTANATVDKTINLTVPTKTSDLTNDSNFITSADLPTVGNGTLTIQKNGTSAGTFTANATSNKTINITVPVKTSDLTNDSGFITGDSLTISTYSTTNGTTSQPYLFLQTLSGDSFKTILETYFTKCFQAYHTNGEDINKVPAIDLRVTVNITDFASKSSYWNNVPGAVDRFVFIINSDILTRTGSAWQIGGNGDYLGLPIAQTGTFSFQSGNDSIKCQSVYGYPLPCAVCMSVHITVSNSNYAITLGGNPLVYVRDSWNTYRTILHRTEYDYKSDIQNTVANIPYLQVSGTSGSYSYQYKTDGSYRLSNYSGFYKGKGYTKQPIWVNSGTMPIYKVLLEDQTNGWPVLFEMLSQRIYSGLSNNLDYMYIPDNYSNSYQGIPLKLMKTEYVIYTSTANRGYHGLFLDFYDEYPKSGRTVYHLQIKLKIREEVYASESDISKVGSIVEVTNEGWITIS